MHCILNFILLFWISRSKFAVGLTDIQSIAADLVNANQSCELDECSFRLLDTLLIHGCHCEAYCVQFDTCCLQSEYIRAALPKRSYTCGKIFDSGRHYIMVDHCPRSDSVWESQCHEEFSGNDDILKITPVTSLRTSVTYKNYFCFRCHETQDDYAYWPVQFIGQYYKDDIPDEDVSIDLRESGFSLIYENGTWIASFRNDSFRFGLRLRFSEPIEEGLLLKRCDPTVISKCANGWTDSETAGKCQAYMGVREVKRGSATYRYRNMHCALCNFENISDLTCGTFHDDGEYVYPQSVDEKRLFSFSYLLDINKSDGDKVGKIQKCRDDHMWDPYAEICRKLTCVLPGYKIKNGKCNRQ